MENVTPSIEPVTEGQIGKFNQNVTARLLKHKAEIPSNLFQQILGDTTLIDEVHAAIRKRIDAMSNMITRVVSVNRKRYAQQALDATGRKQYVNSDVVIAMPSGEGEEAEVIFFKLGKYVSDANLDKEYDLRGLKPADPYSLAAVNEADPAFADEHPNCTHWKDAKGKWCFATFNHWDDDGRSVSVYRCGNGWFGYWWFAGVRK
jgi:hypothetical protein